jgi:hypothetical protein
MGILTIILVITASVSGLGMVGGSGGRMLLMISGIFRPFACSVSKILFSEAFLDEESDFYI